MSRESPPAPASTTGTPPQFSPRGGPRLKLPRVPLPIRLLISYLVLLAIAAVPDFIYVRARLEANLITEAQEQLLEVASRTTAVLTPLTPEQRLERVRDLARMTGDRVTLIAPDGRVLFDSHVLDVATLRNHADREEVRTAITTGVGAARRASQTTSLDTLYAAARLSDPISSDVHAVVRIARPLSTVRSSTEDLTRFARNVQAAAISMALLLSLVAAVQFVRPLQRVISAAKALGGGDLAARSGVDSNDEVGDAGRAIDSLAVDLRRRLANAGSGDAVLAQLVDALPVACVIFEVTGEVLALNGAARAAFRIEGPNAARRLKELISTARFERALEAAEGDGEPEPVDVEVAAELRVKSTVHVLKRPGTAPIYVLLGTSTHVAMSTTLPPMEAVGIRPFADLLEEARGNAGGVLRRTGVALEVNDTPAVLVADAAKRIPRALSEYLSAGAAALEGRSTTLLVSVQVEPTQIRLAYEAGVGPDVVARIMPLLEPLGGAVEVMGQRITTMRIPRA